MSTLNEVAFVKACTAYGDCQGAWEDRLDAAIEAYLAEVFKPGELVVGEAVEPQRDCRKELWMGVAIAVARSDNATKLESPTRWADQVLADFDKRFGETK